jgi:hypothetical protein
MLIAQVRNVHGNSSRRSVRLVIAFFAVQGTLWMGRFLVSDHFSFPTPFPRILGNERGRAAAFSAEFDKIHFIVSDFVARISRITAFFAQPDFHNYSLTYKRNGSKEIGMIISLKAVY